MLFANRADAGRALAEKLRSMASDDLVVLAVPPGGVPVADEVAQALHAPLDVAVVRKLVIRGDTDDVTLGAVGEGVRLIDDEARWLVGEAELERIEREARADIARRALLLRGGAAPLPLVGRTVIVIDDGIGSGTTSGAACRVARTRGARRVVLAVPVAPAAVAEHMRADMDEFLCLHTPDETREVRDFYEEYGEIEDDDIAARLRRNAESVSAGSA